MIFRSNIRRKVITGVYGQAKLNIKTLNPKYKNIILRITIDDGSFPGINDFHNLSLPYIDVNIKKMKTVALAVSFNNGGNISSPDQLKNRIQSELLSQELQILPIKMNHKVVTNTDIEIINNTHADYLVYIYLHANKGKRVGGYNNMYISTGSGTLYIYQLPQGNIVASRELTPVKGYGVSASGAGWNGYSKLKVQVTPGIKSLAVELK